MEKIEITGNQEIAPGIFLLSFRRFFRFISGQVIGITTSETLPSRLYSIASGADESEIRIIYDVKPEGELTNQLKQLPKGASILVSDPSGKFIFTGGKSWWIATGTGIAPFYSMLRSGIVNNITLVHGVRKQESLLFRSEFEETIGKNYFPCVSGAVVPGAFYGRVTEFLLQQSLPGDDTRYYLCGNAEMVVDVRDLLISGGISFSDIISEIYF